MAAGVSAHSRILNRGSGAPAERSESLMRETSKIRKIAFVGDHLPRKCGIPRSPPTCLQPLQQRIRKASAWQCRSTISRKATITPRSFASRLRNRICHRI